MANSKRQTRTTVRGDLSDSAPIWRYMDLAQLYWMCRNKALWFPMAMGLEDNWEGSTPKYYLPPVSAANGSSDRLAQMRNRARTIARLRKWRLERIGRTCLSCWYKAEHESYAMWKVYSSNSPGVAVQSTPGSLRASLNLSGLAAGVECRMGCVTYLDLDKDRWEVLPEDDVYIDALPFFYKRKELLYECEFRAVLYGFDPARLQKDRGASVRFDPQVVIKQIIISPKEPKWKVEVVEHACKDLQLTVKPAESQLARRPII